MRHRKNREINIFSMAALDLFACALGAFFLLMIILFPYYKKDNETLQKLEKSEVALKSCQNQSQQASQLLQQCKRQLSSGILLAMLSWDTDDKMSVKANDIDIFVTDPNGFEYSFKNQTNPNSRASISLDIQATPGFEVFEEPDIRPGTYSFSIALYKGSQYGTSKLNARVRFYTKDGGKTAPVIRIDPSQDAGRLFKVGNIVVGSNGEVDIQFLQ